MKKHNTSFRRKQSRSASIETIKDLMSRKTLKAQTQRLVHARASTAKRLILKTIAPELLELKIRVTALEDYIQKQADQNPDQDVRPQLRFRQQRARRDLHEKDQIRHLGGAEGQLIWDEMERAARRSIYAQQRQPLLDSAGIEDEVPIPEAQPRSTKP